MKEVIERLEALVREWRDKMDWTDNVAEYVCIEDCALDLAKLINDFKDGR